MHYNIERIATSTPDLALERQEQLRQLFPEAWGESGLDWDVLRAVLGDLSDERSERYLFSWAGKQDALRLLQTPCRATLRPAPAESIGWDETQNLFVEADNLEALKLLYKSLFNRVKMIYIDPPYNTGNDFIYPDNFKDPLKNYQVQIGERDANGDLQTSNPDNTGHVHSRWLSMMYPRLFLARQLLRDDGVIFVSINDIEVHHLRLLMNQVFGEENFVAQFTWQSKKGGGSDNSGAVSDHEYVIAYGRQVGSSSLSRIMIEAEELNLEDSKGQYRRGRELNKWGANSRREDRPTMFFPVSGPDGIDVYPIRNDGEDGCWRLGKTKMFDIINRGNADFVQRPDGTYIVYEKIRTTDPRSKPYRTWMTETGTTADGSKTVKSLFDGKKAYDFPKPLPFLKQLLKMGTDDLDDIVLDFFAGSGSTAHAVLELNREEDKNLVFICIQIPELTAAKSEARKMGYERLSEVGKERIKRAAKQLMKQPPLDTRETPEDLGFKVWKYGESHFRQMQPTAPGDTKAYLEQLELMNDALLPDSDPQSVLYEVALREGFGLNTQLQAHGEVAGVWLVSDAEKGQRFFATLEPTLELEALRPLNLKADDLFVCRGIALDDTTAANLALQCRLKMI
jgi:adenine-specific DNA-methyltransferase